jgi:ATP-dependent protease ClpP protease subunit
MTDVDVNRKLYIIGDIDHLSYLEFTKGLTDLEAQKNKPIHIVLMSDGGDSNVALAFHDRIKMSPCKISITGIGLVASAAVLILIAAEDRSMTRNSWLMVHDDTPGSLKNLRVSQVEKELKDLKQMEEQWNILMAEATNQPAAMWDVLHKQETYLSAEKCLELNVIKEIL